MNTSANFIDQFKERCSVFIFQSFLTFFQFVLISLANVHTSKAQAISGVSVINKTERDLPAVNSIRGNGMRFVPNKGQIADMDGRLRPDVLYMGDGAGADIYLRNTGVSYVYTNVRRILNEVGEKLERSEKAGDHTETDEHYKKRELLLEQIVKLHRVDMDFVNCSNSISIVNEEEVEGDLNFYYAHCPKGVTHVKQYNEIRYKDIYNNIDVNYYGNREAGLKYDIVVKPHGDPSQIKLRWTGAENLRINSEGNLVIKTSINEFYESMPKVYQDVNGRIIDIKAAYFLKEFESDGRCPQYETGFILGSYNHDLPLIIDPATWITYYGGNADEEGISVAADALGNAIFSGYTKSANFPVSAGASQAAFGGSGAGTFGGDAFVVKMNPAGGRIFSTYFGGSNNEYGKGITTNTNNDIYITGSTSSTNLPTMPWGAAYMQTAYSGGGGLGTGGDVFVAKFSSIGVLIWSTYYGGTLVDQGYDIVADASDNIIVTGPTSSVNFPVSVGAYQVAKTAGSNAFVVKFDNAGVRQWASYYGAGISDANGVAVDPSNNIYFCGTNYLDRLNPINGFVVWSSAYAGMGSALATDNLNHVFVALHAGAGIATPGAYQTTFAGAGVIKFDNATGSVMWGTYLGGSTGSGGGGCFHYANGIAVDVNNNIVVSGDTYCIDFPTTSCAYQPAFKGTEDQWISVLDQQCKLICSSYLGIGNSTTPNNETYGEGGCIAVSGNFLYLSATTGCAYPVTPGAFQTICGSAGGVQDGTNNDAAFSKLCIYSCGLPNTLVDITSPGNVCVNTPVKLILNNASCDTNYTTYLWSITGGVPSTSTAHNPTGIVWSNPGKYPISVKVMSPCDTVIVPLEIFVNTCVVNITVSAAATICPNSCMDVSATASSGTNPYTYSWSSGQIAQTINVCPLTAITYTVTVTDANGNSAVAAVPIKLKPGMSMSTSSTNITCTTGGAASVTVINDYPTYIYRWSSGQTTSSISAIGPGGYTVTVTDGNGCTATRTLSITSTNPANAAFTYSVPCIGQAVIFTHTGSAGTYSWSIFSQTNSSGITSGTTTNFSYTFLTAGTYNVTHTVNNAGCVMQVMSPITVVNCNGPTVVATGSSVCTGSCASVTSNGSGGTIPYTYSWSNGATTQNINSCPATTTTYTVTIKDAGGNASTSSAVVTVNPGITVTTVATNINCNGSTGSVSASGNSGTSPYTYDWSNGSSGATVSGLAGGSYTVTVTDNKGCTGVSMASLIRPPLLVGQFTKGTAVCVGCGCKEWVIVNAAGGTSPYSYSWPDGYINRYKNQLCPGAYKINIIDKNGCSLSVNLSVP